MGLGDVNNAKEGEVYDGAGGDFAGPSNEALADLHRNLDTLKVQLKGLAASTANVKSATAVVRSGTVALSKFADIVAKALPMIESAFTAVRADSSAAPAGLSQLTNIAELAKKAQDIGGLLKLLPV